MGFFKNLRQGLDAVRNPPTQAEIEASLQHLSVEQRAAYDANMTQVAAAQAESQASWEQAAAINREARVLEGPAGTYLYGASMDQMGSSDALTARIAEVGVWQAQKELRAKRTGEFRTGLRQTFNRDEVEQETDPAARERIAGEERAARAAARAPYRSPDAAHVAISRFATRGETQLEEVVAFLAAQGHGARPERVLGVYRVPDRISQALTPHSEKGRVVEWDVVHLPIAAPVPGPPPALTTFAAADQWVARRLGEPSVLDEDLGLAFLAEAGVGPERCLGLARYCEFRELRSGQEEEPIRTVVRGLVALHADVGTGAFETLRDRAPLALAPQPEGAVCDVLNWDEIARAVRPKIHHPPPVPSPFAYLPSTPQELLRAYLEVVGPPAAGLLQRAGHRRPAARAPAGRGLHHQPRRQAAGRRRQGADAVARLRAAGLRLPGRPAVRRGSRALGPLRGRGAAGRPAQGRAGAAADRRSARPPRRPARPEDDRQSGRDGRPHRHVGLGRRGPAALPVLLAAGGVRRPGGIDLGGRPAHGGIALLALGTVVLVAGLVAMAYGVGAAIGQASAIDDDAVARGTVGGPPIAFASREPELTLYLEFDGVTRSEIRDRAVAVTTCTLSGDGADRSFTGNRQGVAAELGDYSSVGRVTLAGGSGRIACDQPAQRKFAALPFLLTPRSAGEVGVSVGMIIGGVTVAGLGGWAAAAGWLRRRRAARLAAL